MCRKIDGLGGPIPPVRVVINTAAELVRDLGQCPPHLQSAVDAALAGGPLSTGQLDNIAEALACTRRTAITPEDVANVAELEAKILTRDEVLEQIAEAIGMADHRDADPDAVATAVDKYAATHGRLLTAIHELRTLLDAPDTVLAADLVGMVREVMAERDNAVSNLAEALQ